MRGCLLAAILAIGCGETDLGPFQPLPPDTVLEVDGNDGIIHVARDRFGISHVYARSVRDLGFGQGYVMAHDRFPQMDMLRRFASGTLAEVYGESALASDVEMRFHRMRRFAEITWAELQLGSSFRDTEVVELLLRFSDGVNRYLDDVGTGRWSIDPNVDAAGLHRTFAPESFPAWSPVDSIVIMRFFTFGQSWTAPEEIALTEIEQRMRTQFALTPRAGIERDILALAPIAPVESSAALPPPAGALRADVPAALFQSARDFFDRRLLHDVGGVQVLGPHAFMRPYVGSTAFAIGSEYTGEQIVSSKSILAADLQLALSNPSVFYPMHQIIPGSLPEDEPVHDVIGLMLPGVPIVIAGTNQHVGWAPTLGTNDINDVYLETLQPCPTGTCSLHAGIPEPLETFTEDLYVGSFGEIEPAQTRTETFEVVPRHGPIIRGRTTIAALTVKSSAYAATHELANLWSLGRARTVGDADTVLAEMRNGPHWMILDQDGVFAWTSYTDVPDRPPTAFEWSATSPKGAAPFFIYDGNAPSHEWRDGYLPRPALPFRLGPPEKSIVITDADPTQGTFDGNPLNDSYAGIAYANGLRGDRLTFLINSASRPVDVDAMARFHHDTRSLVGEKVVGEIVKILGAPTAGPSDAATYYNGLSPDKQASVATAHMMLADWEPKLDTPLGNVAADSSSAATLLFNTWMRLFSHAVLDDEFAASSVPFTQLDDDRLARIVYRVMSDRASLVNNPVTNQPMLCDRGGNESCSKLVIEAALAAVEFLTTTEGGRDDWRWGRKHGLRMTPLFRDPSGLFTLPRTEEQMFGLQLQGDMFAVDRADGGWDDESFEPHLGVAYRMLLVGGSLQEPLGMRLELPTGTVLDRRDPHYRDLHEKSYVTRTGFDVPITIRDINLSGESRWEFR